MNTLDEPKRLVFMVVAKETRRFYALHSAHTLTRNLSKSPNREIQYLTRVDHLGIFSCR